MSKYHPAQSLLASKYKILCLTPCKSYNYLKKIKFFQLCKKKKLQKSRYYSFQMILMFLYNTLKATTVSSSSIRHCSFLYKLCLRHIHIVRSFMRSWAYLETVSMYYGYNSLSTLPIYLYKARLWDSKYPTPI